MKLKHITSLLLLVFQLGNSHGQQSSRRCPPCFPQCKLQEPQDTVIAIDIGNARSRVAIPRGPHEQFEKNESLRRVPCLQCKGQDVSIEVLPSMFGLLPGYYEVLSHEPPAGGRPVVTLKRLISVAAAHLGRRIHYAVAAVPLFYDKGQREVMKLIGKECGIEVLAVIDAPIAAATAVGLGRTSGESIALVVDFGWDKLEAVVLHVHNGVFDVISHAYDMHLGGRSFHTMAVDLVAEELYRNPSGILEIEDMNQMWLPLSRARFEAISSGLFDRVLLTVGKALAMRFSSPKFSSSPSQVMDINHLVLVGGASRMPKFRELMKSMAGGIEPMEPIQSPHGLGIKADEATVYGTAIIGAMHDIETLKTMHSNLKSESTDTLSNQDRFLSLSISLPIGLMTVGGSMAIALQQGVQVASASKIKLTTSYDYQTSILLQFFEDVSGTYAPLHHVACDIGHHLMAKDNFKLGHVLVANLTAALRGITQIELSFQLEVLEAECGPTHEELLVTVTVKELKQLLAQGEVQEHLHTSETNNEEYQEVEPLSDESHHVPEASSRRVTFVVGHCHNSDQCCHHKGDPEIRHTLGDHEEEPLEDPLLQLDTCPSPWNIELFSPALLLPNAPLQFDDTE